MRSLKGKKVHNYNYKKQLQKKFLKQNYTNARIKIVQKQTSLLILHRKADICSGLQINKPINESQCFNILK